MLPGFQDTIKFLPDYLVSTNSNLESEDLFVLVQKLAIAVLIGAFIGLEREHSRPHDEKTFAGIRTFPLISILGFTAALIASITTIWVYAAVFIGFSSLVTSAHIFSAKKGRLGGTSEISTLLVFVLGSLVYWNFMILAAVITVIIALFLTLKIQLHRFVGKINEEDLYATLKLALITVIVLPLLPDKTYGPLNVLNPRLIWYMVIFISGISFVGYILIKFYGKDKGIAITGLMGGLVSSTAVTFSLSKKSKANANLSGEFGTGIILASSVMFPRVFIIILVLNNSLVPEVWLPLMIFSIVGGIISYFISKKFKHEKHEAIDLKNPFELRSALLFGVVFGVIIFVSKAAEVYMGAGGIYVASGLGGLTNIDAIVLSLAKLSKNGINIKTAGAALILALIANTIFKAIITITLGSKELKRYTLPGFGVLAVILAGYFFVIVL